MHPQFHEIPEQTSSDIMGHENNTNSKWIFTPLWTNLLLRTSLGQFNIMGQHLKTFHYKAL